MARALLLVAVFSMVAPVGAGQAVGVLQIRATLRDAEGNVTPVPRHTLLISDNPATALPRVVVTKIDGTAQVRLPPGSYTVESEQPIAFQGKAYRWTQLLKMAAGRDAVLELTTENAEVEAGSPEVPAVSTPNAPPGAASATSDPAFLLGQWQNSVVRVWTPTAHASGTVIDARGLVATSQRAVRGATSVEVQLSPELKVAARVLAADSARDVAVLWIDPKVVASARPLSLQCDQTVPRPLEDGQEIFAIVAPIRGQKEMTSGSVVKLAPDAVITDLRLPRDAAGGPAFTADGVMIGLTSRIEEKNDVRDDGDSRVVRAADACGVVGSAEKNMKDPAPSGTPLPVEPAKAFPVDALRGTSQKGTFNAAGYTTSSGDFELMFITPPVAYRAQYQSTGRSTPTSEAEFIRARAMTDFSNWSDYVAVSPPVLMIRATPKLVEGFWKRVGREAARTQGIALPPLKGFKSGFSRMRVFCGSAEITPIHPFKLELVVPGRDTLYEGLYVFDPAALGPHCGTVKVELYSEKEPDKADSKPIEPALIQQIWNDFAPYRQ